MSKDILPFPLSFCPRAAEISLEAGRAQLDQAKEPEATLDTFKKPALKQDIDSCIPAGTANAQSALKPCTRLVRDV